MNGPQPVPVWFVQEYLALISNAEKLDREERLRLLIFHHAELNYKLLGGGKCSLCHSSVRHVVAITVEQKGREIHYDCLCTRCIEGERGSSERVILKLGRGVVEYKPKAQDSVAKPWDAGETQIKSKAARRHG